MTAEEQRLAQDSRREKNWSRWGTYLSERQWGTVREDYSADGNEDEFLLGSGRRVEQSGKQDKSWRGLVA